MNIHQRAKAIFGELIDLPSEKRAGLLKKLCEGDAELEKEVASLLEFHTVRSLMADKPPPKIRTKPTLSTTRFDKSIRQRSLEYLAAGTPLIIVLCAILPSLWYARKIASEYSASSLRRSLETEVGEQSQAFQNWHLTSMTAVESLVSNARVRDLVDKYLDEGIAQAASAVEDKQRAANLQQAIEESLGEQVVYSLLNRDLVSLAHAPVLSTERGTAKVGQALFRNNEIVRAINGEFTIRFPNPKLNPLPAPFSDTRMVVCCPVKNSEQKTLGVLILQCDAFDASLRSLLASWNSESYAGESYLLNAAGERLSEPKNSKHLQELERLLTSESQAEDSGFAQAVGTIQNVLVRDPGVAILEGKLPEQSSPNWPLTEAADALSRYQDGINADGYRNYVGTEVVGAWRWLATQRVGIVHEVPRAEAFAFRDTLDKALGSSLVFSLLAALVGVIVARPRRRPRQLRTVGPYQIKELIGEGGMGKVYLAEHSLLCRPTAVKILSREKAELSVLMRFEREVQLASQLTHPNTIAIYDFGRNDEGIFYYAMEYVDGGHIGQLIEFAGPLPEGRCIYLVRQLCFALREAHLAGVVHRDIKPQNVMVCDRGGEPDFIKLVDYGLVKAFVAGISDSSTQTNIIIGTPRFMAPERLQSPWLADPRVDIYSIGALLYFMLTAELPPLVAPTGSKDPIQLGVETIDIQPHTVPFGDLLSMCMSYEPAARPSSVASLLHQLDLLAVRFPWTRDDSENWWKERGAKFRQFLARKREQAGKS